MTCVVCDRKTAPHSDARLPLLRVLACVRCRDIIALDVGWKPTRRRRGRRAQSWYRGAEFVTVPA